MAGKPGSGKTTAAETAAKELDAYYFSISDELRAIGLHNEPSKLSEELRNYTDQLKQHLPVPAHIVEQVVEECIENSSSNTIIVDGYPQYVDRLPGFESTLARVKAQVVAICEIDVKNLLVRIVRDNQ